MRAFLSTGVLFLVAGTLSLLLLLSFATTVSAAQATATLLLNDADPAQYFGGMENKVYLDWVKNSTTTYPNSLFLTSNNNAMNNGNNDTATATSSGAAVHWDISNDSQFIHLAVAVRATGWVGFGVSENGGMPGSDVVLFETATLQLRDAHILEERVPVTDTNNNDACSGSSNDWTLVHSQVEDGFIIFEAVRLLNTGDSQDRAIVNDSSALAIPATRIIAAWGDTATAQYHGPQNVARGAVRFFTDNNNNSNSEQATFEANMAANADGSFLVQAQNHAVRAVDTDYVRFCVGRDALVAQGISETDLDNGRLHMIGYEPVIDATSQQFVHHLTVRASPTRNNGSSTTTNCQGLDRAIELAYAWAPGEGSLALPRNVGAALGGATGYFSFEMETHYNNPGRVQGAVDNSGVRFYYTNRPREIQAGVLQLGDPALRLSGQPLGNGLSVHSFHCPASCTSFALQEPVTVVREYLHMHQSGRRIKNEQFRDGKLLRTGAIDFFSFDQQGNQAVQQEPFQVLPGDSFNTACYYRTSGDETFGLSSQEEMCMAFIFYYPRQMIYSNIVPWICGYDLGTTVCDAKYTRRSLTSDVDFERAFGGPNTQCNNARPASTTAPPRVPVTSTSMPDFPGPPETTTAIADPSLGATLPAPDFDVGAQDEFGADAADDDASSGFVQKRLSLVIVAFAGVGALCASSSLL